MVGKKEARSAILYARIRPSNLSWLVARGKFLGFSSQSEYIDALLEDFRKNALDESTARARKKV